MLLFVRFPSLRTEQSETQDKMHIRYWRIIVALWLIFSTSFQTIVFLRHHIRDLSEVARTYSTFYPYLGEHPETLFRYHTDLSTQKIAHDNDTTLVPKILHQVFLTEGRPSVLSKYQPAIDSCHALHPEWKHNVWNDDTGTSFIATYYPHILPHYQGYEQSIQRANILRYALLDHFGGVYLDLDITCLQPLDNLRALPFVTPGAYPAGVNNAFILARPGHPFLKHLLEGVKSRDLWWGMPYIENMLSTGCMFFSNRWMSYVRSLSAAGEIQMTDDGSVYILADTNGGIDAHMLRGKIVTPLFEHGGASSWHGWDAAAIVMIGKYYRAFAIMLAIVLVVVVVMIWRFAVLRPVRRRSWHALLRGSMDKTDDREAIVGWKEG